MRLKSASEAKAAVPLRREVNQAVRLLRDGDTFIQEKALETVLASKDELVIRQIVPLLEDKDTGVRMAALEILKKMGHLDRAAIIPLVYHENEDIRVYGCEILGCLKDSGTVGILVGKLEDEDDNVRTAAVTALGEFRSDGAIDALLSILKENDWIAFSAIYGLGKIGSKRAQEPLMEVFRSRGEEISLAACEVLLGFKDEGTLNDMFLTLKRWGRKRRGPYIKVILEKGDREIFERAKDKIGQELFDDLLQDITCDQRNSFRTISLLTHFKVVKTCDVVLERLKEIDPDDADYEEFLGLFAGLADVWGKNPDRYLRDRKSVV
jgi:HEAT repeat protein